MNLHPIWRVRTFVHGIEALSVALAQAVDAVPRLLIRGAEGTATVVHAIGWWLALTAGVAAVSWSLWRWATRSGS